MVGVFRYGENEYDDDFPGHDVVFLHCANAIGIRARVGAFAFFVLLSHALIHWFDSKLPTQLSVRLDA